MSITTVYVAEEGMGICGGGTPEAEDEDEEDEADARPMVLGVTTAKTSMRPDAPGREASGAKRRERSALGGGCGGTCGGACGFLILGGIALGGIRALGGPLM